MSPQTRLLGLALALAGLVSLTGPATPAREKPSADLIDNGTWVLHLAGFFGPGKPLNVYPSRRDGRWVAALGTSRLPRSNRSGWNVGKYVVDMAGVRVRGEAFQGTIKVLLTPDPWVPADRQPRHAEIEVRGKFTDGRPETANLARALEGTYQARLEAGVRDKTKAATIHGNITGGVEPTKIGPLDNITYGLMFQDLIPGGRPVDNQRRLWVGLGVKDGKVVSARAGLVSMRHIPFDVHFIAPPAGVRVARDGIRGELTVPVISLDGDPVRVEIRFQGGRVQGYLAGTYTATVRQADGKTERRANCFDGTVTAGAEDNRFARDGRPWFVPVKGWRPVAPGEHPRLFFRKGDLPALRARARTPEGKYLVARLRTLLGGGEALPTSLNSSRRAYTRNGFKPVEGSYSISHAAGFGFLYQLTGEKKYADLARRCVELAWKGQRDFDDRYAWVAPGGELRAGPSLGWYAVAYDLCYDAWPEDFRARFARAVQDYDDPKGGEWGRPEGISLRKMVLAPKLGPNSNHYGSVVGGCGLAVLAIKGDPGTDRKLLEKYDAALQRGVVRNLTTGFGDGGYFYEGHGAAGVSSDPAFLSYLQALRVAAGRDYVGGPRPSARAITLLKVWELLGPPAVRPYRSLMDPTYGSAEFWRGRGGMSHGGEFCQGFGAVPDASKPALLWCYNTFVEPDRDHDDFDTVGLYPHRPMLALINWPFGRRPRNPGEVLPKVHRDSVYEYWVFRNRWRDSRDVVVTALLNGPKGTKPRGVLVWGLGTRSELPADALQGVVTSIQVGADRSGVIATDRGALAVDFSKASGADALVVLAGSASESREARDPKVRSMALTVAGRPFTVLTLSAGGKHPEIRREGGTLVVGGQKVRWDGKTLVLSHFRAEKP